MIQTAAGVVLCDALFTKQGAGGVGEVYRQAAQAVLGPGQEVLVKYLDKQLHLCSLECV